MSLFLTLNRFHTLFWCFHCWLWSSKWRLGSLQHISFIQNYLALRKVDKTCSSIAPKIKYVTLVCVKILGYTETHDMYFHDGGPYHIEASSLICRANQWNGFYINRGLRHERVKVSLSHCVCLKIVKIIPHAKVINACWLNTHS